MAETAETTSSQGEQIIAPNTDVWLKDDDTLDLETEAQTEPEQTEPEPDKEAGEEQATETESDTKEHSFNKGLQKVQQDIAVIQRKHQEEVQASQKAAEERQKALEAKLAELAEQLKPRPETPEPTDPLPGVADDEPVDAATVRRVYRDIEQRLLAGNPDGDKLLDEIAGGVDKSLASVTQHAAEIQRLKEERQYHQAMQSASQHYGVNAEPLWLKSVEEARGMYPGEEMNERMVGIAEFIWCQKLESEKAKQSKNEKKDDTPPPSNKPPRSTEGTQTHAPGASTTQADTDDGWLTEEEAGEGLYKEDA